MSASDFVGAAKEHEVTLTTTGRKSGKPRSVTIWITTDGKHVYIRSGQGLIRDWPQNLLANAEATVRARDETFRARRQQVRSPLLIREGRTGRFRADSGQPVDLFRSRARQRG